jgi:predicted alpha-1,2-mannosidase
MKSYLAAFLFLTTLTLSAQKPSKQADFQASSAVQALSTNDVLRYVNPLIGTAAHGHTFPGATYPFGMVQLSPDNGMEGWDWCGGYNYADSSIAGFSHTHFSGTGIGDLCDISVMPVAGTVDLMSVRWVGGNDSTKRNTRTEGARRLADWSLRFSHKDETATAGYYRVQFPERGITAELTASELVGVHRYTFAKSVNAKSANAGLVVDLSFAINWDRTTDAALRLRSSTLATGYRFSAGWARGQKVFFAMEFSRPVLKWHGMQDIGGLERALSVTDSLRGTETRACFEFGSELGNQEPTPLTVKVALSSASEAGAIAGLRSVAGKSFDRVRSETEVAWRRELSKIQVETLNDDDRTIFTTALYHSFVQPNRFSDACGEYTLHKFNFNFDKPETQSFSVTARTPDGKPHGNSHGKPFIRYDLFSLWDTFRATHPLYTLLQPTRMLDIVRSLVAHWREFGLPPIWSFWGSETRTMTGYHSVPVLADAALKGFLKGRDLADAYAACKAATMEVNAGLDAYRSKGYVPHDVEGFSVTRTIEYAFDDWAMAQFAQKQGLKQDAEEYTKRAGYWKNLFDTATGFVRGRMSDGRWKIPFDALYAQHGFTAEYIEGNAWQYSWFAPHDPQGLIAAFGGKARFVQKLDSLFFITDAQSKDAPPDISGLIGQYAHGNEPSHHIPYLYNEAGAPHKTQERVRNIIRTFYNPRPDGLCGNDDCGQMSSWLVFSMMGLYPVNPAGGVYAIGSPLVKRAVMQLGSKTFTISAENVSDKNLYIQSATLNGKPLLKPLVRHEDILRGGELRLRMGEQPSTLWVEK